MPQVSFSMKTPSNLEGSASGTGVWGETCRQLHTWLCLPGPRPGSSRWPSWLGAEHQPHSLAAPRPLTSHHQFCV